jgi:hypothetical protein
MFIYTSHTENTAKSKKSCYAAILYYSLDFYLNKRVTLSRTQGRLRDGVRVEEWLAMVDFDTIPLSLSFQVNRLSLTTDYIYINLVYTASFTYFPCYFPLISTKDLPCGILVQILPGGRDVFNSKPKFFLP